MAEDDTKKCTLDLSKKCLKKVPKDEDAQSVRVLLLDDNELQKLDNIDSYLKIEKLSLSKNQLLRMYGICRLHCLRELNLSFNGILTIEGLKELVYLTHLNLEGNNIKTIEHLNANTKLEYLNLSENSITSISDVSFLKCLKELHLHGNRITHLRQCDKFLPMSLEILTLAKNNINDLNEICTLTNLCNLHTISIIDNPCVKMTGKSDGFDHRPFVLNWCMSVKVIDGFVVDPIESLKAEWLYSQGKGRQFRVGDQEALAKYLSSVCPLLGKALESESERKLRLILSKAQQHQRQLQEEISENSNTSNNNSPSQGRKKPSSRIQSPRFSRLSGRQGSPDSMSNSYHGNMSSGSIVSNDILSNTNNLLQMTTSLIENIKNDSMSQSMDGTISCSGGISNTKTFLNSSQESITNQNQCNDDGPLTAASKMVPVPESLMSPDCCPTSVSQRMTVNLPSQNASGITNRDNKTCSPKILSNTHFKRNEKSPILSPRKVNTVQAQLKSCLPIADNQQHQNSNLRNNHKSRLISSCIEKAPSESTISSDDDSDHINVDKLKTIRNKAAQRSKQNKGDVNIDVSKETETCAIVIQKVWRGYQTRKKTKCIAEKLLKKRTQEYIEKLTKDMEITKAQLENERKIQQLQMHAINALWKKISSMQSITATNKTTTENDSTNTHESNNCSKTIGLDNDSTTVVNDLAKTCSMLTNQVQQLQGSMRDILNCMTVFCNLPPENIQKAFTNLNDKKNSAATQTEIIAVSTPQIENLSNFPFKTRPSSLPLETTGDGPQQKVYQSLVEDKTSEFSKDMKEITHRQSPCKTGNVLEENEANKSDVKNTICSKASEIS